MSSAPLQSKRILLVEDEALVRDILERILKSAGYIVKTAANGVEGLRLFKSDSWDLVITDGFMPEMGGEELAAAIRNIAPKMSIILATGTGGQMRNLTLFDGVLAKPVTAAELRTCVAQTLSLS